MKYEDVSSAPYYPGKEATAEHREGLFIGYRYFETANVPVLYPFGLEISFKINNSGEVAGAEIAQLYFEKQQSTIFRAKKELKGFTKVFLQPQESKVVTLTLTERDFSYYDAELNKWIVEPGEYELQVGGSIQPIQLRHMISQTGEIGSTSYTQAKYQQRIGIVVLN